MDLKIKEKRQERAAVIAIQEDIQKQASEENRKLTGDELARWDKANEDYTALSADITRLEDLERKLSEAEEIRNLKNDNLKAEGKRTLSLEEEQALFTKAFRAHVLGIPMTQDEREAFQPQNTFEPWELRTMGFDNVEQRAQSTTDAKGGYTIPTGFSNELEIAMAAWGGVREVSRIWPTATGNTVDWPAVNDTTVGVSLVAEAGSLASGTDATFTQPWQASSYKYTTKFVKVSHEIIRDSAFDFIQLMKDLFARRMGSGLNSVYTTADGSSKPAGVVTGATDSGISGVAAAAIDRNDIVGLLHSLDPAYRGNARFMFNDNTLKSIRLLSVGTSDNRPLWIPSMRDGVPATIEGYPYTINQDMANVGASAVSMLFGDFKKYVIREVGARRMVVANELYLENDQVGLCMLMSTDAKVIDAGTNPIMKLTHPAT